MFGCGGFSNGTAPARNTYAYLVEENRTNGDMSVAQFQVGSDGSFTALNPPSIASEAYSSYLAADPSGQFFFVNGSENWQVPGNILQLVIGSDGTLSPNSVASITTGNGAGAITFTPNGRFAIVPSVGDNTLSSYSLDSTGSFHLVNSVLAGFGQSSVAIDSTSRFAYVTAGGTGPTGECTLTEYTIAADGTLTPTVTYPLWNSPGTLVVSSGGFLYLNEYMPTTDGGMVPGSIVQFSVGSKGGLNVVKIYSTADSFPGPVVFNPGGTHAYVSNGYLGTSSQFTVDPTTGILAPNGTLVAGGILAMDPSGNYGYAATWGVSGTWAPQVLRYAINSDGTLSGDGTSVMLDPNSFPQGMVITQH